MRWHLIVLELSHRGVYDVRVSRSLLGGIWTRDLTNYVWRSTTAILCIMKISRALNLWPSIDKTFSKERERTWARRKNTHQLINSQFLIGPITDRYCFLESYMYNIKFWNKSPPLEFFFFRAVHSTERRVILLLIYRIWLLTSALKEEEDPLWFLFIYLFYISSGQ